MIKKSLKKIISLFGLRYELISVAGFGVNKKGGITIGYFRFYKSNTVLSLDNIQKEKWLEKALELLTDGRAVLLKIDKDKLRQCWFYPLSDSPITQAASKELISDLKDFESNLFNNYNVSYPKNAAERVGIYDPNHKLAHVDVKSCPLPWETRVLEKIKQSSLDGYLLENNSLGLKGCQQSMLYGPLSLEKIRAEYQRISKLRKSILEKGYIRNNSDDGDIFGQFYIDDTNDKENYVVRLDTKGNHRASVLVNLGWSELPVRINPENVVRLSEVEKWHYVKNQTYSRQEAITIFKKILYGEIS